MLPIREGGAERCRYHPLAAGATPSGRLLLAIGQLDDPAVVGVLVRSVLLALAAYGLLLAAGSGGSRALLATLHWPALDGWLGATLGTSACCCSPSGCSCRA